MTPVNKVTELKARKTKLSTIVTAISGDVGIPVDFQMLTVNEWDASSARVIVHSAYKWPVAPSNGVRVAPTKHSNPLVADVLRAYIVQIPGNEIFAIAAPNIRFNGPQVDLFAHVEKEKMERAWACYCSFEQNNPPKCFILSAPVLPHILRDIPNTLTFDGVAWSVWLDGWLSKFMLKHRYFNGNQFNLISPIKILSDEIEEFVPEPAYTENKVASPTQDKPKNKGGRPKKIQQVA